MTPHVRWLIRRDMPQVLQIEAASFAAPWDEEDFLRCLRQRNCIAFAAEYESHSQLEPLIGGYMIYELHKKHLTLLNLAVHPDHRRKGVGTALLDKLYSKLSSHRRTFIQAEVGENLLPAQLWLKASGWRAIGLRRGQGAIGEDLLLFQRSLPLDDILACGEGESQEVEV